MKKGNQIKHPGSSPEASNPELIEALSLLEKMPAPQPASAQTDSRVPASLSECSSSDDLARYLHTLGWRGILDPDWTELATLWTQIDLLFSEINALSSTQP